MPSWDLENWIFCQLTEDGAFLDKTVYNVQADLSVLIVELHIVASYSLNASSFSVIWHPIHFQISLTKWRWGVEDGIQSIAHCLRLGDPQIEY